MCPSSSFAQRERIAGRRMAKGGVVRKMDSGGVTGAPYPGAPEEDYDAAMGMIRPPSNLDPAGVTQMPEAAVQQAISAPSAMPAPGRLPHEQLQDKEAEWLLKNKQPNPAWWRTLAGAGTQFLLGHRSPAAGAALSGLITDSDPKVREYQTHVKNLGILNPIAKGEREDLTANARYQQAQNTQQTALNIAKRNADNQKRLADAAAQTAQNQEDERMGKDYEMVPAETMPPPMQDIETASAMPSMPATLRAATPQTMQAPAGAPIVKPGPPGSVPRKQPVGNTPMNYVKRETMHEVTDAEAEAIGQPDLAKTKIPQSAWVKLAGSRNRPAAAAKVGAPDTRIFDAAARQVAAKHGITLKPDEPLFEQLPIAQQQEATALYENKSGGMDAKALQLQLERERLEHLKNQPDVEAKKQALKMYQPALDAAERFNVMSKNYQDGLKGNQQAMVSLLMNHIGMTLGAQKGARVTKDVIHEAASSLPWLERVTKSFDPNTGLLSGITLSPEQMKQMVSLGREKFSEETNKAHSQARYIGLTDGGPNRIPSDATLDHYMALAGGDPAKARQLAAADGWTEETAPSKPKHKK